MSIEVDPNQLIARADQYYSAGIYMTGVRPGRFVENVLEAMPGSTTAGQAGAGAAALTGFVTQVHDLLQSFGNGLMTSAGNYQAADDNAVQALNIL